MSISLNQFVKQCQTYIRVDDVVGTQLTEAVQRLNTFVVLFQLLSTFPQIKQFLQLNQDKPFLNSCSYQGNGQHVVPDFPVIAQNLGCLLKGLQGRSTEKTWDINQVDSTDEINRISKTKTYSRL